MGKNRVNEGVLKFVRRLVGAGRRSGTGRRRNALQANGEVLQ